MPDHYLYLEAVNLGTVIDDTEDLSTRRAGGYMLLELVQEVAKDCNENLETISIGASAGLFKLRTERPMAAARAGVERVLSRPLYTQATVLVADTETDRIDTGNFKTAREGLLAAVRHRQMQTLGWITEFGGPREPPLTFARDAPRRATEACEIDRMRPAVREAIFKKSPETRWQSLSVTRRRDEGIGLRRRFYARELKRETDIAALPDEVMQGHFTDHFDELTAFDKNCKGDLPPALEHKMAVFYADGDSFGALAAGCESADELNAWDRTVQSARRSFLRALVDRIRSHPYGRLAGSKATGSAAAVPSRLRLETLMWGGDEFRLVLPAWLALEAVELFFQTCNVEWPKGQRRSHSAALVFAHHNAPIGPLQRLASDLADTAKAAKKSGGAPGLPAGADSLSWIVLESFDHAGGELDRYWQRRELPGIDWPQMSLSAARLSALRRHWPQVGKLLPRRALHRIVYGLQDWTLLDKQQRRLIERAYANVHEAVDAVGAKDAWRAIWQALQLAPGDAGAWSAAPSPDAKPPAPDPAHLSAWLTLNELWDYLQPDAPDPALAGAPATEPTDPTEATRAAA